MHEEDVAWLEAKPEDLWLFDKLILSRKMGYVCGPAGVDVPEPGKYIVRPCVNVVGMGRGAEVKWIDEETDELPPGTFWCEIFEGRHLSVDYYRGIQVICVEGFRHKRDPLYRWYKWLKTDDVVLCPEFLRNYPYLNCEYIDGNLIEVHLRYNPDFIKNDVKELIPVWKGEVPINGSFYRSTPPGYRYVSDPDFERMGFLVPEE